MSTDTNINIHTEMTTLSQFFNRMLWSSGLRDSYKGARDIYSALGYPVNLQYQDYLWKYLRHDIARACIDRPIHATWRGGVSVNEPDPDSVFQKTWQELARKHKILSVFKKVDRLASIGHYAVILIGYNDVSSASDLIKPVIGKRKLLYLVAKSEEDATIATYDLNSFSPRYGLPELYDIKIDAGEQEVAVKVHHSRIIHITGEGGIGSAVFGDPVLRPVYNRLLDLEKVIGGSAEMFWRGARPGYTGTVDDNANLSEAGKEALKAQLDEFDNNLRRFLVNKGVKIEGLPQQIADPTGQANVLLQAISAATGIPRRILIGSERGELASSQDKENWAEIIEERRLQFAEIQIIYPFLEKMIEHGVLPSPSGDWQIEWRDLYAPSDKEQAEIGKIKIDTVATYVSVPGVGQALPLDMFLEKFLGWQNPDIEQLLDSISQQAIIESQKEQVTEEKPEEEEVVEE